MIVKIGQFNFDTLGKQLTDGQTIIHLRKKEFHALQMLVARPGQLISNQTVIDNLWDGDTRLGLKGIRQVVWKLRSYFGDSVKEQQYIETVPGIGYRFVYPLENNDSSPSNKLAHWMHNMLGRLVPGFA